MAKTNRCVVRNQSYRRGEFSIRERHNERKNVDYHNGDIVPERSPLNVAFKSCPGTYEQEFNRMVDTGVVSLRGLKPDAKVFDELVFDVNSAYFENHGGYDYARQFFAEAYKQAAQEAGGEEYVLSAVLHTDERNRALSEQLGRDVYHYHLHVVYVPVVDKEIYFKKNNKNPDLAGKLREIVKQVSHSKKWPRFKGDNGQWVNSYSLLQDRFFDHMRGAGFTDFERGERGSTAEHLDVLEYKIKQDKARSAALSRTIKKQQNTATDLAEQAEKQQKRLDDLEKKTKVTKKSADAFAEIDRIAGKHTITGAVAVSQADWKTLSALAKEGQKSRSIIKELQQQNAAKTTELAKTKARLKELGADGSITEDLQYFQAKLRAPLRLSAVLSEIMSSPPEKAQGHDRGRDKAHTR